MNYVLLFLITEELILALSSSNNDIKIYAP